jgi:hypothetical protein
VHLPLIEPAFAVTVKFPAVVNVAPAREDDAPSCETLTDLRAWDRTLFDVDHRLGLFVRGLEKHYEILKKRSKTVSITLPTGWQKFEMRPV